MRVGVLKEIKAQEYRVAMTPAGVRELTQAGHSVLVETHAGSAIDFDDSQYQAAGATIVPSSQAVFEQAKLIVKVKEPQLSEIQQLKPHHILFAFLHLAPDPDQCEGLLQSGASCIAYETVENSAGELPLLAPMSEVAGRLAVQAAAKCLEKTQGGAGVLLAGLPGVPAAEVLVLGGGVVGLNAARMAAGLGARVTVVDQSIAKLRAIDDQFGPLIQTLYASTDAIESRLPTADVIIGAVLVSGAATPKLLTEAHLLEMKPGSVLVDVAIDQGGCFATSKPTTHQNPTFIREGIVHYCVANMPGAVAKTATLGLSHATAPYVRTLADNGLHALSSDAGFRKGLNVHQGGITHASVALARGKPYCSPEGIVL